jgi:hypothetical protein
MYSIKFLICLNTVLFVFVMRRARPVARMGKMIGAYRGLVRKPEGNSPLGRPLRRWEDNIKMDLYKVGCGGMDWFELAEGRDRWRAHVNAVMKLWVSLKCGEFLDWLQTGQLLKTD